MVLDPMSMCARDSGPFEGLLHSPSARTHTQKKEKYSLTQVCPLQTQSEKISETEINGHNTPYWMYLTYQFFN